MVCWPDFLGFLVAETLQQARPVVRDYAKLPFTMQKRHWMPVLVATCMRLGWVCDSSPSERTLRTSLLKTMECLDFDRSDKCPLTIDQVAEVVGRLANRNRSGLDAVSSCPQSLLRGAEAQIISGLGCPRRQKNEPAKVSKTVALAPKPCTSRTNPSSPRASLHVSTSRASSRPSTHSGGAVVTSDTPIGSDRSSSVVAAASSESHGHSFNLLGLPQLPANLDDLSSADLRRLIVSQHAAWIRAANKLATTDTRAGTLGAPRKRKRAEQPKTDVAARRRIRYWKNKAKSNKKASEQRYQQLAQETQVYIQSKRRKATAFVQRLTTFGGYRLALARNLGHASCAATLSMLDADASRRQTMTRS